VLYWRTFWDVLVGLIERGAASWRFVRNILLAFLPAAVIGLAFHKQIEAMLGRPDIVAVALIVGGVGILAVERFAPKANVEGVSEIPAGRTLGIGIIQCLAMVPGISRSGATIMGALALGVERRTAAEFSFFLAIPTMLGATVVELAKNHEALTAPGAVGAGTIAIGFLVSFMVALLVVKGFVAIVSRHGFAPFAWYRIIVGAIALLAFRQGW
jgi:undecaprenyl-diphosphatase